MRVTFGNVIGIIFSLIMIIGGLTGSLALRGTNSSIALVVVGVLFLLYDISKLYPHDEDDLDDMDIIQEDVPKEPEDYTEEEAELFFQEYAQNNPNEYSQGPIDEYLEAENDLKDNN